MKQFGTIFLVAEIAVIMFFPRLTGSNEEGGGAEEIVAGMEESGSDSAVVAGDGEVILLSVTGVDEKEKAQKAWEAFGQTFPGYQVVLTQEDVGVLKDKVASGEAECAFVLDGFTSYTYYVNNLSMYDAKAGAVDETLKNLHYMDALMKSGVEEEAAGEEEFLLYLCHDFRLVSGDFAVWADGGDQCRDGEKL